MRKLTGKEDDIKSLMNKKISYSAIGRILGVHRLTVSSFVKEKIWFNFNKATALIIITAAAFFWRLTRIVFLMYKIALILIIPPECESNRHSHRITLYHLL